MAGDPVSWDKDDYLKWYSTPKVGTTTTTTTTVIPTVDSEKMTVFDVGLECVVTNWLYGERADNPIRLMLQDNSISLMWLLPNNKLVTTHSSPTSNTHIISEFTVEITVVVVGNVVGFDIDDNNMGVGKTDNQNGVNLAVSHIVNC